MPEVPVAGHGGQVGLDLVAGHGGQRDGAEGGSRPVGGGVIPVKGWNSFPDFLVVVQRAPSAVTPTTTT
jgi:hypothetical protein